LSSRLATLRANALAVQAWIAAAFYLFILVSSNPFLRLANAPAEGRDLNPLLQDIGLAIVPRVTVIQELAAGTLVGIPLEGLEMSRPTLMIFRDRGYVSDCAQQFIDVVKQFNWESWVSRPVDAPAPRRHVVKAIKPTLKTKAG